jgi:hypothetical protein
MGCDVELTILAGLLDSGATFASIRPDRSGLQVAAPGLLTWIEGFAAGIPAKDLNINWIWLGGDEPDYAALRQRLSPNVLFAMVDPDGADKAMAQAVKLLDGQTGLNIFNHPIAVMNTRRDFMMQRLGALEGVEAPRTIRIEPQSLLGVRDALTEAGIRCPFIYRSAGVHGGDQMELIETPDDLYRLERFAFDGGPHYVIEFKDYRDADGLFRKYRFVFIGAKIYLRHAITGEDWLIHSRARVMNDDTIAFERRMLGEFETALPDKAIKALTDIYRTVGLDFFGLDCAFREDGALIPFEANAAMDIFRNTHPQYDLWTDMLKKSSDHLWALLHSPDQWKKWRRRGA